MLKDGYTCTDRISFGSRLRKAVTEFTEKFIPHMAEEEEVFQPLLVKYFAREELLLLKEQVIQQHEIWKEKLLQQKETARVLLELLEKVDENGLQTLVDRTTEKFAQVKVILCTTPTANSYVIFSFESIRIKWLRPSADSANSLPKW